MIPITSRHSRRRVPNGLQKRRDFRRVRDSSITQEHRGPQHMHPCERSAKIRQSALFSSVVRASFAAVMLFGAVVIAAAQETTHSSAADTPAARSHLVIQAEVVDAEGKTLSDVEVLVALEYWQRSGMPRQVAGADSDRIRPVGSAWRWRAIVPVRSCSARSSGRIGRGGPSRCPRLPSRTGRRVPRCG